MSPLSQKVQEIKKRVDDRPGNITTERVHQQRADTTTLGLAHIECACERQNHDQPKQELRNSLHGFQTRLGVLGKS